MPQSIQEAVEKGYIRYGVAVELARLQEHSATPEALEWWMLRAITKNMKVEDFRDLVTKHIASRSSSQISLADIFQEESMALQKRLHIRKVVASNMVAAVWVWIHYLEKVSQLLRDGLLGKEDSPFSEGSPKRIFRNLIEREKELLPLLQQLLPKQVFKRAQTTLGETEAILNSLPNGEDK